MGARIGLRLALALSLLLSPAASVGQGTMARVGFLTPSTQPAREAAFREELRRLGYVESRNIAIEYRSADGNFDRLPALAAELVARRVDIVVAVATQAALAARNATGTIPIVIVGVADPVGAGLVTSLSRPGGNITGTSNVAADVVGKQLELLRELRPKTSRVAVLWNPANAVFQQQQLRQARAAAARLKIDLRTFEARAPGEIERAFTALAAGQPDAVLVLADPVFGRHAGLIAQLSVKARLPAVSGTREYAEAGALMTYGPDYVEGFPRAATYVDRILKGAKPSDLPIEEPAKFELVLNGKTATALGVTIPRSIRVRAEHLAD